MKATIDGAVVADALESELITIEGNQYIPPSSLRADAFSESANSQSGCVCVSRAMTAAFGSADSSAPSVGRPADVTDARLHRVER